MTTTADGLLAMARGAVPAGVSVYDTIVDGVATQRYVVMHIPDDLREAGAVDAVSDLIRIPFYAIIVVSNDIPSYAAAECRDLARRVRTGFVDQVVTGDGMSPARVVMDGVNPPQPDELTPNKKVFIQAQFSLMSVATS